jgi:hypothetical protein
MRRLRVSDSVLFGAGTAILMNSRPFEGCIVTAAFAAGLLIHQMKTRQFMPVVVRFALPVALVVAITGGAMMYYFWRTTGNPLLLPYSLNLRQYQVTRPFIWEGVQPTPQYNNVEMRDFYLAFGSRTAVGPGVRAHLARMFNPSRFIWNAYSIGWPLLVPLLIGGYVCIRQRRGRVLVAAVGGLYAAMLALAWPTSEHYNAPVIAASMVIILIGLRKAARHSSRWLCGRAWVAAILLLAFALNAAVLANVAKNRTSHAFPESWWDSRVRIQEQLKESGGRHLIVVRYGPGHDPAREYVENAADIDGAPVVWARELGGKADAELIRYFQGRKVWVLDADREPPWLEPYAPRPSEVLSVSNSDLSQAALELGR